MLVGVTGLEPATSCTPSKHSSHLSYTPENLPIVINSEPCQSSRRLAVNRPAVLSHTTVRAVRHNGGSIEINEQTRKP